MTTDKIVNKKKYRGHDNSLDFFIKGRRGRDRMVVGFTTIYFEALLV
jgi:hypothetical protein